MMHCAIAPLNTLAPYRFVVCLAVSQGQWLLVRHEKRTTWETAGGHIEAGETPLQAARLEFYEETGAVCYTITPAFDYSAGVEGDVSNGQVFAVHVEEMGKLPPSEIAEVALFDKLPENLTYPGITPRLFTHLISMDLL